MNPQKRLSIEEAAILLNTTVKELKKMIKQETMPFPYHKVYLNGATKPTYGFRLEDIEQHRETSEVKL